MNNKGNIYHGVVAQSIGTESFNISVTNHRANSFIPPHVHNKPYLCFSIAGFYKENSISPSTITPGSVLFRRANYEHANQFLDLDGVCLNLEFKDIESLMIKNSISLPSAEFERQITVDMSRLIVALNSSVALDLIDVLCYEAVLSNFQSYSSSGNIKWISDVINYIKDDPLQIISLDKLSQEFQLHPNYIIRKFKEKTGYKLSEYLEKIRIEYSLKHLMQSDGKIGEIAIDSGFYDQSHFNRTFRKLLGVTPKQFRNYTRG